VSANTKYGYCRGCEKWVPRDGMLSINVTVYNEQNQEKRIPLRFCEKCHSEKEDEIESMRWDNVLHTEAEIQADVDLAERSELDFDPTKLLDRAASDEEPSGPVFRDPVKRDVAGDDSEAAMRKQGKNVDMTY